jgi:hypothetical protein
LEKVKRPILQEQQMYDLKTPVDAISYKFIFKLLPIYRATLSPTQAGLEVGMAHGYFLIGPFYTLGPMRNSDNALVVGFFSVALLAVVLTLGILIYSERVRPIVRVLDYDEQAKDYWRQLAPGFLAGALGGDFVAYLLLANAG